MRRTPGSPAPGRLLALTCLGALLLGSCTPASEDLSPVPDDGAATAAASEAVPTEDPSLVAELSPPADGAVVLAGTTAAELAVEASATLFASAPAVVLAAAASVDPAGERALELGVPLLLDGAGAAAEIQRLGADVVHTFGDVTAPQVEHVVADTRAAPDQAPSIEPPEALEGVTVLTSDPEADAAALATARAAGADVVVAEGADPRATSDAVQALAEAPPTAVIALGSDFGDPETVAWRTATAATGVELPGGGQLALPGKTYVALYGTPSTGALGVLGEQPIEQTIERAREHAGWYEPFTDEPVIPTLEIIATVASVNAGRDNAYSNELPPEDLRPLIDLAWDNGLYVVIDLQPGRYDFLSQAKRYEELLKLPHVGLALDPEWRLGPNQRHLVSIGTVSAEEINGVVTWLADLTRENNLPQKVLVLHQFQTRMIPDAEAVDLARTELAVLIHADGQGSQPAKQDTWRALHNNAPSITHWGWKNFYDEDVPMLTPEQTMTQVEPVPDFISYQ